MDQVIIIRVMLFISFLVISFKSTLIDPLNIS